MNRSPILIFASIAVLARATASPESPHLVKARALVSAIVSEIDGGMLRQGNGKPVNQYGGSAKTVTLTWSPVATCYARCNSFISLILQETYPGWSPKRAGFRTTNPQAGDYHDAFLGNSCGFTQVTSLKEMKPGDILASKYLEGFGDKANDTGHMMLVESFTMKEDPASHTETWDVRILDCTGSPHADDTRTVVTAQGKQKTSGAGAETIQILTDADGVITGYRWSTRPTAKLYISTQRNLVLGRFAWSH